MRDVTLAAVCAALFFSTSRAAVNDGITVTHFETLQTLSIEKGVATGSQKVQDGRARALRFTAFGREFDLQLEPNDRLLSAASQKSLGGAVATYRGKIEGQAGSWARLVIAEGTPRGLIWDGTEMFAVEAPDDNAVQSSSSVIYRLADTHVAPGAMSCGAVSTGSGAEILGDLVGELGKTMVKVSGAVSQIEIGAVGDYEFFNSNGGGSEVAILTRLNNVDGIYSEQLGVQVVIDELQVFTTASDPFSAATDAGDLLDEVANYRVSTNAQRSRGLTHLYTGRDLDSNTVGIAFVNQLCHSRYGAGLSQASSNATFDSLVAAHEIGHNFGAPHDGEKGSACGRETGKFIMSSTLNGSETFSACSIEVMQPNIDAASCITALPTVDVSVAVEAAPQSVFLGNEATVQFGVANNGSDLATNAALEVTLPANVSLDSATASQGTCTSGAGVVDCALGTISAGSSHTVTLLLTAVDPGNGEFAASASADADNDPDNNAATAQMTVDPAVDLAVDSIGSIQMDVDQSASVAVTLQNRSVLNASGVELSVSLADGLEAEAASWPLGGCTLSAQQVTCTTDHFPAQSDTTLDLDLRKTTDAQLSFEVSLTSTEADANAADNRATGTTTVSAAAATQPSASSGSSPGGGGAVGLLSLALAGCAALRRRRSANRQPEPLLY
ncbi:MAG: M12 family metallo-peptidase [Woeseia sp.]